MKKMYVFVALLSTCSIASAQENKEESLKREVTIEKRIYPNRKRRLQNKHVTRNR